MPTINAGFDLFETKGDAFFTIPHGLAISEDFFHKGSAPFTGIVRFRGYPLRKFHHKGNEFHIGYTDTVVERKKDVEIKGQGQSGETPIELVALSLRSAEPLEVQVGNDVQLWDVRVSVSRKKPSTGSMTITLNNENGGVFDSVLNIYPHFVFERQSDGEERQLDIGAMEVPSQKRELASTLNTLRAMEVPWQTSAPKTALAIPKLTNNFVALSIAHHQHWIVASRPFLQ
jgi:hypothetical protein